MGKKLNKAICSLFLVLILLPSFVKLGHKHLELNTSECNQSGKVFLENCAICNFEFSPFVNTVELIQPIPSKYLNDPIVLSIIEYHSKFPNYTFCLRAPPTRI